MTDQPETPAARAGVAFLNAIVAGDFAALDALMAPGIGWWVQGWGLLDRDRLREGLAGTIGRSTEREMVIERITAQDDRAAIEAHGRFAFAVGDYCNTYVYLIRVDEAGRIVEGREYLDTAVAARFYALMN